MSTFYDFRKKYIRYVHYSGWAILAAGAADYIKGFPLFITRAEIEAGYLELDDLLCPELFIYGFMHSYAMYHLFKPTPDETPEEPSAPDAPASAELLEWLGKAIDANAALTEALEHMQILLTGAVG